MDKQHHHKSQRSTRLNDYSNLMNDTELEMYADSFEFETSDMAKTTTNNLDYEQKVFIQI